MPAWKENGCYNGFVNLFQPKYHNLLSNSWAPHYSIILLANLKYVLARPPIGNAIVL